MASKTVTPAPLLYRRLRITRQRIGAFNAAKGKESLRSDGEGRAKRSEEEEGVEKAKLVKSHY